LDGDFAEKIPKLDSASKMRADLTVQDETERNSLLTAGGEEEDVGVVVLALAEEGRTGLGLALSVLTLFPDNAGVGEA